MKQKRQVGILLILVLIAAVVWRWNFQGGKPVVTADAGPSMQDDPVRAVENPHPRVEDIDRARKTEYKGSGRNPFSYGAQSPASGPQKPAQVVVPKMPCGIESGPCPEPPPPPLTLPANVKFYGFGGFNGTARRAFFTDGEEVSFVGEGDVFLKRFRILRIGNANLEFEEIATGRIGTAPLEEQAAGPQQ